MTAAVDVYWLEQAEGDVPAGDQWLSSGERSRLAALRFDKRRTDWRLGRWTAKRAVASRVNLPIDAQSLQDIEIRAASSGVPEVYLFNQRAAVSVSLSHRAGKALCVVGLSGASLGCDLELIELRDHSFLTDFLPLNERPLLITLLWSAKESALKALHVGLRLSTTSLEVRPPEAALCLLKSSLRNDCADWSELSLRSVGGSVLSGWWRCANNMVRTVVFHTFQ